MLKSKRGSRRNKRLRMLLVLGGLALVAGLGYAGATFGKPRYKAWKEARALAQAREYLAKRDAENARLALDVALLTSPGSPQAWRVAADLLEQIGAAQTLRLRRQVVQLAPDSMPDRAALVATALRFRDLPTARDALADLTPEQAGRPEVLRAALAYALATDAAPVADALYDRLRALSPDDDGLVFAQATLHLRHPNPEKSDAARARLAAFAEEPARAPDACRALLADALVRQDHAGARSWADRLVALPEATLDDQLQLANLRLLVEGRPLAEILPPLQTRAGASADEAVKLARWLLAQRRGPDSLRWLQGLPPELAAAPAVADLRAQLQFQRSAWDEFQAELAAGAWGPVPPETVKLALAAHLLGKRERPALRRQIWDEAVDSTAQNLAGLRMLVRISGFWEWQEETERALASVAKNFPEETWAALALFYSYREQDKAPAMRELAFGLAQRHANVPRFQHDWALLDILTEPTPQWNRAKETLKRLHEVAPANPYFITSRAVAEAQAGRGAEALKLADSLSETDRLLPARAPYLAFVYAVARRKEEAERYLELSRGQSLLTEEKALLAQAQETLRAPSKKPVSAPSAAKPAPAAPPAPAPAPSAP